MSKARKCSQYKGSDDDIRSVMCDKVTMAERSLRCLKGQDNSEEHTLSSDSRSSTVEGLVWWSITITILFIE